MAHDAADYEEIDEAFLGILSKVIREVHGNTKRDRASQALLCLLVRTANTWRSILTLKRHSCDDQTYTIDAAVLLRCIFDAYLQAHLIYRDANKREEVAELYLDFAHVDRFKAQERVLRHNTSLSQGLKESLLRQAGVERLQKEYDGVKAKYYRKERLKDGTLKIGPDVRDKWYEGNLSQLANQACKQAEYDTFIVQYNGCVHSSAFSVKEGPAINGNQIAHLASGFTARVTQMSIEHSKLVLSDGELTIITEMARSLLDRAG
jgi:Family of unknown function (DUF5677)